MSGPAWLGIGGQRCGTTWFTDLLRQHPAVDLAVAGRKELHELYLPLVRAYEDDGGLDGYRALFADAGDRRLGECTPYYLRAPWVAPVAASVLADDAVVVALVRDPIVRFESTMRLAVSQGRFDDVGASTESKIWVRYIAGDAIWAGQYVPQLDTWHRHVGDRLHVLQYEQVRDDPQAAVDRVWRRMGLDPVDLADTDRPSHMARGDVAWSVDTVPGLRDELVALYAPQQAALADRWGLDPSRWTTLPDVPGPRRRRRWWSR